MPDNNNEQLTELISNSQVAFLNGRYQEAFSLAKEAIKLDSKCANAYQCAANVCMSLSRYEDAIEYYKQLVCISKDSKYGGTYFSNHDLFDCKNDCFTISKISDSFGDFIHSLYVEEKK